MMAIGLGACSWGEKPVTGDYKRGLRKTLVNPDQQDTSVLGEGGLFGGDSKQGDPTGGIGVNSFLWRASLDTISFMPLVSADPFGGVIITDWYSPAATPDERFKINVFILGRTLRADGVRAAVFRQRQDGSGGWADEAVAPETVTELENAILTRARQIKIAQMGE
jgi:hypothetical protein